MGTDLGYAVLIGLGAMKLTQIYKEIVARLGLHQVAWIKSIVSMAVCTGLAFLILHLAVETRALIALAAAGIAALSHAIDTVLRSHRDELVANVLTRSRARRP